MRIDTVGVERLAADLAGSAAKVRAAVTPAVSKGALNIKNEWNDAFRRSRSFKGIGGSVNYDIKTTATGVEAEIGPDKDRYPGIPGPGKTRPAAALANIAHFGGSRGGGGTVADPQTFADHEAPGFEAAIASLAERSL